MHDGYTEINGKDEKKYSRIKRFLKNVSIMIFILIVLLVAIYAIMEVYEEIMDNGERNHDDRRYRNPFKWDWD